ncbi:CoA pyrophosphatase [Pseudoalteromonas sp. bablab_jr011]|uniref:NUDIX hydrolase n=1 Tax=Pseudoalteromonas sp. bablab_jr011 TaxID=2755062 RepID=UPI00201729D8|nr:CoA pyrophosphatase [Pseudoalteromonas sp. bablab_jr011]
MNSQQLITRFSLSMATEPAQQIHINADKRASAVMLPLIDVENDAHLILCKRPRHLLHHPGEICLPGGKFEMQDESLMHTALRELHEELNIAAHNVTVHGQLHQYSTLTGFTIAPYVCSLAAGTCWQADPSEVEVSFLLPISHLSDHRNWQPLSFQRNGKTFVLKGLMTPHGLLWGATASIINNFIKQLALPV